jgi:hypothetical protein
MLGGWRKPMTQSQQVEANEASLRALYGRVFDAFQNTDASTLSSGQKDKLPLLRKSLEPAETISLIQIAAVMKAILAGKLEWFFPLLAPEYQSVVR